MSLAAGGWQIIKNILKADVHMQMLLSLLIACFFMLALITLPAT